MSLRDKINENPGPAAGVGIAVLIIAAIVIALQLRGGNKSNADVPQMAVGKMFFTDDDGASWFVDDVTKIPPFDHNGRKAYRAVLYEVAGGKKYVAFMQSYEPADKTKIEAALAAGKTPSTVFSDVAPSVKKPGSGAWVTVRRMQDYIRITHPTPPQKNDILHGPLQVTIEDLNG